MAEFQSALARELSNVVRYSDVMLIGLEDMTETDSLSAALMELCRMIDEEYTDGRETQLVHNVDRVNRDAYFTCSNCGNATINNLNLHYCPNCGHKVVE